MPKSRKHPAKAKPTVETEMDIDNGGAAAAGAVPTLLEYIRNLDQE
jgi:hypothetical protein